MSPQTIKQIVEKNSFTNDDIGEHNGILEVYIFGFVSLINHCKQPNIKHWSRSPLLNVWYADRDIKKGEEILIDYLNGASDSEKRSARLKETWGITSE